MFCYKCGNQTMEGAAFCQKCGTKLMVDKIPQQPPVTPISATASKEMVHIQPPTVTPTQEQVPISAIAPNVLVELIIICDSFSSASIQNFYVFVDGNKADELPNDGMIKHKVIPGKHNIVIKDSKGKGGNIWIDIPENNPPITLRLQSGTENPKIVCDQSHLVTMVLCCPECNKQLPPNTETCTYCGTVTGKQYENKLFSIAKFCRVLSVLRFVDVIFWVIIILTQIAIIAYDPLGVIWNIAMTCVTAYFAAKLWPNRYIEQFKQIGKYDQFEIGTYTGRNGIISLIGLFTYIAQLLMFESEIFIIPIMLEATCLIVSFIIYGLFDKRARKAFWNAGKEE